MVTSPSSVMNSQDAIIPSDLKPISIWTKSLSIERTVPRAISPSLKDRSLLPKRSAKLSPSPDCSVVSVMWFFVTPGGHTRTLRAAFALLEIADQSSSEMSGVLPSSNLGQPESHSGLTQQLFESDSPSPSSSSRAIFASASEKWFQGSGERLAIQAQNLSPEFGIALRDPRKVSKTAPGQLPDVGRRRMKRYPQRRRRVDVEDDSPTATSSSWVAGRSPSHAGTQTSCQNSSTRSLAAGSCPTRGVTTQVAPSKRSALA